MKTSSGRLLPIPALSATSDPKVMHECNITAERVVRLARSHSHTHIIQQGGFAEAAELGLAALMQNQSSEFFNDPVGCILDPKRNNAKSPDKSFEFTGSNDQNKDEFSALFRDFLLAQSGLRKIRDEALMVAEELFSNGQKHAFPSRRLSAQKSMGNVDFFAAFDQSRLAMACVDSFGLLDFNTPLERIIRCIENGVTTSIQNGSGGAGIGSYLIYSASTTYCLAVERGVCSVVACALPIGAARGETIPLKNLHILKFTR